MLTYDGWPITLSQGKRRLEKSSTPQVHSKEFMVIRFARLDHRPIRQPYSLWDRFEFVVDLGISAPTSQTLNSQTWNKMECHKMDIDSYHGLPVQYILKHALSTCASAKSSHLAHAQHDAILCYLCDHGKFMAFI